MELGFQNSFVEALPGDFTQSLQQRQTPGIAYCAVKTSAVSNPKMLIWSPEVANLLPLSFHEDLVSVFAGNSLLPGMSPYAARYGGHQFGHWAGQLGDGRAISLGETNSGWEIQLKGAGITPYSRRGDGRAVLRSSIREYLCSEAMHYLGIPTTRALCCVLTGDKVVRDMFYDGHPEEEPGAITTRVAQSFIRFGNFEIFARSGEIELLKKLTLFTINKYFPQHNSQSDEGLADWFKEVCERTAALMAKWLSVGFVHGVMNTDNLSILGLTIDYGPYGWLDVYEPDWTPNTTDAENRRYRYSNQPQIALWNLARLAEAISPLVKNKTLLELGLQHYQSSFQKYHLQEMAGKLGLKSLMGGEDLKLVQELDFNLRQTETDMTIFYRQLAKLHGCKDSEDLLGLLKPAFYNEKISESLQNSHQSWIKKYFARVKKEEGSIQSIVDRMNQHNPYFILRNYLAQEAIDELAQGQTGKLDKLALALKTPFEENENTKPFFAKRPDWARSKPGCSALSCSS